jgi:hypothetical protein
LPASSSALSHGLIVFPQLFCDLVFIAEKHTNLCFHLAALPGCARLAAGEAQAVGQPEGGKMVLSRPLARMIPMLMLLLLVGCSLTKPTEIPGSTEPGTSSPTIRPTGSPTVRPTSSPTVRPTSTSTGSLDGTWSGILYINTGGSRPVTVVLNLGEGNAFTGMLTFTDPVIGTDSALSGTLEGDQFRFQEAQGRYVWGSISGETLSAQVAWDCFECTVYAQLTLGRGEANPGGTVRFLGLSDGSQVQLTSGRLGPQVETRVEATGVPTDGRVFLQVDGLDMAMNRNSAGAEPFETTFTWWPWHGNGDYLLEVSSWDWNACCQRAVQTLTVHVAGFPAGQATIRERFIRLYQDKFGLSLTAPLFARYVMPWSYAYDVSRWVSSAYIGDTLYEIELFDNGTSTTGTRPIGHSTPDYYPLCRPAGSYRMLVVFVDYGNTGITRQEALQTLATANEAFNRFYLEQSNAAGVSTPLLQIEATGAFLDKPTSAGKVESTGRIAARTGQDLTRYDLLVEVDLDADRSVAATQAGLGFGGTGCFEGGSPYVDIYFTVDSRESLFAAFPGSVFDHELAHSLGWMHWWPNGDASVATQYPTDMYSNPVFPTLLLGWTDADGDGLPEILDPTPYGMAP